MEFRFDGMREEEDVVEDGFVEVGEIVGHERHIAKDHVIQSDARGPDINSSSRSLSTRCRFDDLDGKSANKKTRRQEDKPMQSSGAMKAGLPALEVRVSSKGSLN